jgi:Protein of unknown function (DUF3102)
MTAPAITKPKPTAATIRQINAAHDAVVNAARDALQNAIRAGELLCAVKDAQDHGDWETWLTNNCPNISSRTARLYMHLSKKENELTAAAEQNGNTVADLSVREAQKLLAQPLTEEQKAARAVTRAAKKAEADAAAKKAKPAGSADLTDLLKGAVDADEIGKALKDAGKSDEVETELITRMSPAKVCDALTKAWSEDQIKDLRQRLGAFLGNALSSTPQDTTAPAPDASARRSSPPHAEFGRRV